MFSSVRNIEHVRNALNLGAHACTVPWNVLKQLCSNHFTELGIKQFVEHTEMSNIRASDLVKTDDVILSNNSTLPEITNLFKSKEVDNIVVTDNKRPVGIIDIQDVLKWI